MTRIFLLIAAGIGFPLLAFSQFTLKGTVTDPGGQPVAFAHIFLQNTYSGTYSGNDGSFEIRNLKAGTYKVEVSFIGYKRYSNEVLVNADVTIPVTLQEAALLSEEVVVQANAINARTPVAYSELSRQKIAAENTGQDITYMLSLTPSVVVSSDAGTGIGYTGISVRGSDVKRINVTVNGIPINDSESHGVWWVNMPDIASSVSQIQIQRGVGTSTNGAGAFGATVNMQTNILNEKPYAEIASSAGSFSTFKNTVSVGTGLINNHFTFDARLSKINSDGFIDRSFSDLKSFYLSGGWYTKNGVLKLTVFSGKEITYQAWWGVPKVRLENDLQGMQRYLDHWLFTQDEYDHMLKSGSRTYNYYTYKNEIDHYQQDHYQLHYSRELNKNLFANFAIHYTYGRGYYEGYKPDKKLSAFALPSFILGSDTITRTDLITQKWLDNDFAGAVTSLRYVKGNADVVAGTGFNRYYGRHFGDIIWAKVVTYDNDSKRWYYGTGDKTDFNVFVKGTYSIISNLNVYADIQLRNIGYTIKGTDDDLRDISQTHHFSFFNPKAGINYMPGEKQKLYLSWGSAHREPTRSDYTDADSGMTPRPEKMMDYELGYMYHPSTWMAALNLFYMDYTDQLIMTGQINNVGAPVMVNVPESYRRGIEMELGFKPANFLSFSATCAVSQHKIKNYSEYVEDWDNGGLVKKDIGKTDISFSPGIIASLSAKVLPLKDFSAELRSRYVGRQYIDNSESDERSLDPYFVSDFIINYKLNPKNTAGLELQCKVVNLFNEEYETFAWAYRYLYGGTEYTMDGYFPQAGRHFLAGIVLRF